MAGPPAGGIPDTHPTDRIATLAERNEHARQYVLDSWLAQGQAEIDGNPDSLLHHAEPNAHLRFVGESLAIDMGVTLCGVDVSGWLEGTDEAKLKFWTDFESDAYSAVQAVARSMFRASYWEEQWAEVEPVLGKAFARAVREHPDVTPLVDVALIETCPMCTKCIRGYRVTTSGAPRPCRCTCHLPCPNCEPDCRSTPCWCGCHGPAAG